MSSSVDIYPAGGRAKQSLGREKPVANAPVSSKVKIMSCTAKMQASALVYEHVCRHGRHTLLGVAELTGQVGQADAGGP
jgi:hypothetical protein